MTEKKDLDFGILASNFISSRREYLIDRFPIYESHEDLFNRICDHESIQIAGVYRFLHNNGLISESLFLEYMTSCEDIFTYENIKRTVKLREEFFGNGD